jgi:sec-independent protein translocase protein TatC
MVASIKTNETRGISEHVGELKKKIFIAFFAFIIGAIITHLFNPEITNFLLKPSNGQNLIFLSPLDPLLFIFKIDFMGGFIISFPVILWSIFSYINPALPLKIRKTISLFYFVSALLLFLGLIYAFFVTIPLSLRFLFSISIPGISNSFSAEKYLSFFITQAIIVMIVFQVPVLVTGGVYLEFFKTKFLSSKRRYIYLILIISLAIITPTTDIFSLLIILVPCIFIFEISLIIGKLIERFHKKIPKLELN